MSTVAPFNLRLGDAVSGVYYGIPFSGKVAELRPHYCDWDQMVTVELDQPITMTHLNDPTPRAKVQLKVDEQGRSNWGGGTCYLNV